MNEPLDAAVEPGPITSRNVDLYPDTSRSTSAVTDMTLDEAKAIMSRDDLTDKHPQKINARKILGAEAARIEAIVAAMDDEDSEDGFGDDIPDVVLPSSTVTASPASVPVTEPQVLSVDTSDSQLIDMTLEQAQTVMKNDFLPDNHPQKVTARKILGAEAERIEAQIKAMDNEDTASEDGFGESEPTTPVLDAPSTPTHNQPTTLLDVNETNSNRAQRLPKLGKVDRTFSTEDERIAASASVEETSARLTEMTFDFGFGESGSSSLPVPAAAAATVLNTEISVPRLNASSIADGIANAVTDADELATKKALAQAEARKLACADFDIKKIEERNIASIRRREESKVAMPTSVQKLPTLKRENMRKYATEDERVNAEADISKTNSRLESLDFDFNFGTTPSGAKPKVSDMTTPSIDSVTSELQPTNTIPNDISEDGFKFVDFTSSNSAKDATKASVPSPPPTPLTTTSDTTKVAKKLPTLNQANLRKYNTEDERVAAEASVEDTNARLADLSFDFNFG